MFRAGSQLAKIVDHLTARGVSLWHACQLVDFESYLAVAGIPSRSLLEQARVPFTAFVTDTSDRSVGVWSKVFVNLSDFGWSFAHGHQAVPNPYGPIVFQIRPTALLRASDAAFCLRSAGARDFDRDEESLDTVDEIEPLFAYPATYGFPESSHLRFGEELRTAFAPRFPEASAAEVSLTLDPELIPLEDVVAVWVDPLAVSDRSLVEAVMHADGTLRVRARYIREDRRGVLDEIARYLADESVPPSLRSLAGHADASESTHEWARNLLERDLDWQFRRYAQYLRTGTLGRLRAAAKPAHHEFDRAGVDTRVRVEE